MDSAAKLTEKEQEQCRELNGDSGEHKALLALNTITSTINHQPGKGTGISSTGYSTAAAVIKTDAEQLEQERGAGFQSAIGRDKAAKERLLTVLIPALVQGDFGEDAQYYGFKFLSMFLFDSRSELSTFDAQAKELMDQCLSEQFTQTPLNPDIADKAQGKAFDLLIYWLSSYEEFEKSENRKEAKRQAKSSGEPLTEEQQKDAESASQVAQAYLAHALNGAYGEFGQSFAAEKLGRLLHEKYPEGSTGKRQAVAKKFLLSFLRAQAQSLAQNIGTKEAEPAVQCLKLLEQNLPPSIMRRAVNIVRKALAGKMPSSKEKKEMEKTLKSFGDDDVFKDYRELVEAVESMKLKKEPTKRGRKLPPFKMS